MNERTGMVARSSIAGIMPAASRESLSAGQLHEARVAGLAGSCWHLVSLRLTTGIEHQRAEVFRSKRRRRIRQMLKTLVCGNHHCVTMLHSPQMCMCCAHMCAGVLEVFRDRPAGVVT